MRRSLFNYSMTAVTAYLAAPCLATAAELTPQTAPLTFGGPSGTARDYAVTSKSDYARESFQADVTVTVKSGHAGHGIAFVGLGKGEGNAANFLEPTTSPSLVFRLCPNDFGGAQVSAAINGEAAGDPVALGDGTHRVRLTWDATRKQAWLEIHPKWNAGDVFKPSLLMPVTVENVDFGNQGRIFVGGAGGATFADFSVKAIGSQELARMPVYDSFPKDATARTWLPIEGTSAAAKGTPPSPIDAFLKNLRANFRPVLCWYKGPSLEASRAFSADGSLTLPHSKWSSSITQAEVTGDPDARDLTVTLRLNDGSAQSAGLAASFDFADWSTENYVLLPASIYNGNRNRIVPRGYAQGLDPADYYRKDLPLSHASVPCLALEKDQPSKLEVNSSNVTTPSVCVFDKKHKRGFILLAEQASRSANGDFLRKANGEIMDNAFAVEESADRSRATIVVSAPGVREKLPAFIGFSGSPDRGLPAKAGDAIVMKLRLYDFPADGIPAVLEKFMTVRKSLIGPNHPRNLLPASEALKWMNSRIENRYLQNADAAFYMPENGPWIAFGWIGGWMNTFPMLALGDAQHLDRVTKTFDHGLKAQEPSGYFHYAIDTKGNVAFREPKPDMNLSRCHGDILYWMIMQFELLKAQGRGAAIKPEWEASMKSLANALVKTWKRDGQWGKMVNVKTGAVSEYNTTGGAMCIGGLALAGKYFKNPEYITVSKEAARYYYERDFVKLGQTTGACADILQNAESETAFGFVQALMALYDVTGEKEWLMRSRNAANLAATWIVSHDYELPKFTALGQLGTRMAGVFWASTQNKHGAPGICTSSGDALMKIFRATGETRYADLLRDINRAHDEGFHGGGGTERLTFCDAEARGDNPPGSNGWTETNGAMMALQIPGIYVRTDTDRFYVFDAMEAKVLSRSATGVKVEVRNSTKFDAKVSVLAEDTKQALKPMNTTAFLRWPKIDVKAGETRTIEISPTGAIR